VTANDLTSSSRGGGVVRRTSSPILVGGQMPDQYTFTVTANTVDAGPASVPSAPVSLPPEQIAIVPTALGLAPIGLKYGAVLKATGGFGTFTWKRHGPGIAKGIHLSTTGAHFGDRSERDAYGYLLLHSNSHRYAPASTGFCLDHIGACGHLAEVRITEVRHGVAVGQP